MPHESLPPTKVTQLHHATSKLQTASDSASKTLVALSEAAVELAQMADKYNNKTSRRCDHHHHNSESKAYIINDFVKFLSDTVEVRNPCLLKSLAHAYLTGEVESVNEFVDKGFHIVLYAKHASNSVKRLPHEVKFPSRLAPCHPDKLKFQETSFPYSVQTPPKRLKTSEASQTSPTRHAKANDTRIGDDISLD
ncbi:hypothetical protein Ae201684P_011207 [Aphanomyces euteiches]|uniref:Uncharacterized protein n=1 Tax=Aphanomyces euteiches TaxID=100861 RepID=A0A6G0XYR4_9STRA|nr:hypothetical protein Ae201684_000183 [Aphanomyces euteiches]KAH9091663.1 hypothetical protein Ae201684P_011207 [Aphanomyces euteiches]